MLKRVHSAQIEGVTSRAKLRQSWINYKLQHSTLRSQKNGGFTFSWDRKLTETINSYFFIREETDLYV